MSGVHVFTSITTNYLPKARVLAESVKKTGLDIQFHLMLCDAPPPGFDLAKEHFDSLLSVEDLPIENLAAWLFSHSVVEMCTAVKGMVVELLFDRFQADKVFYFDPDMVVFSRLDELVDKLDRNSVLLTPHQTEPEISTQGIIDNEIASLTYGVFNLGFLGVRNDKEGRQFSRWWRDRLMHFCYDDLPRGLFTDQKWVNLAPCFFDRIDILRSPAFNVATWNLTHRVATGSLAEGIFINGEPLGFYHFSGFDSGAQEVMLKRYGTRSPVLFELRDWYLERCEARGQSVIGSQVWKYGVYEDSTPITQVERRLYRMREDLQKAFPNPFSVSEQGGYRTWYAMHSESAGQSVVQAGWAGSSSVELGMAREQLVALERDLSLVRKAVAERDKLLSHIGEDLSYARKIVAERDEQICALVEEVERVRQIVAERDTQLHESRRCLESLGADLSYARGIVEQRDATIEQLQAELERIRSLPLVRLELGVRTRLRK